MLPHSSERPLTLSLPEPILSQLDKEEPFSSITEWQRGLLLVGEVGTSFPNSQCLLGDLLLRTLRLGGRRILKEYGRWKGVDIIEEKSEYMQGVGPGLATGCLDETST
jgi:hypothetical protein